MKVLVGMQLISFFFSVKGLNLYSTKCCMSGRSTQLWWVKKQKHAACTTTELKQSIVQNCSLPEDRNPGRRQWVSKQLCLTLVTSSSIWEANGANLLQSTEGKQVRKQRHPSAQSGGSKGIYTFCPRCTGIRKSFPFRIRLIMRDALAVNEPNPSLSSSSCLRNSY